MKRIIIANGVPIAYHITGKDYINYLNDAKKKKNINPAIQTAKQKFDPSWKR